MQRDEGKKSIGYLELIRSNPNFRNLWTGQVISLLGDWFDLIASASLISYLTRSGLAVGSLFVIRMLAPFLVSPLAGVLADRFNRKRLLIVADILRGIVVLGFLFVRTPEQVWLLYVITAIQLGFSGIFFPARNAILPDIVSRAELGVANAISTTTWSVMLSLGAALGGIVAGQWGNYPAFVVDSISFFCSAFFIARIQYIHQPPLSTEADKGKKQISAAFRQYIDGLGYLRDHKDILAIALQKSAISLFVTGAFQVIQVALAERVFVIGENGSTSLGLIYAAAGIGTGIGPIVARVFTRDHDRRLRFAITISYVVGVLGLMMTAPLAGFALVLLGTFVRSLGAGVNWTFSSQLLLEWVPNQVRGRVFSSEFALFTLSNAISSAIGGWALDNTGLGISGILWWMTASFVIPGILWFAWTVFGKTSADLLKEEQRASMS